LKRLLPLLALAQLACGGKHSGSSAPAAPLTPATVTLALLNAGNAAPVDEALTFFASVTYPASGTLTFLDGTTMLGTAKVTGTAQSWGAGYTTSALAIGPHALTAQYSGDAQFATAQTETAYSLVVVPVAAPTSFNLASTANPSTGGQTVTFTATITYQGVPAPQLTGIGTVTFLDGVATLEATTLDNGIASCPVTNLTTGSHTITAVYSPMVGTLTSTSTLVQVVN
jgi:hypothetical protein